MKRELPGDAESDQDARHRERRPEHGARAQHRRGGHDGEDNFQQRDAGQPLERLGQSDGMARRHPVSANDQEPAGRGEKAADHGIGHEPE